MEEIIQYLQGMENEIQESTLSQESEEVLVHITGYIIKKLLKRFGCDDFKYLFYLKERRLKINTSNSIEVFIVTTFQCLFLQ